MATAILPLVVALIGLVLYALASNPKVAEIGRIVFFCGMLTLTWTLSRVVLRLP